LSIKIASFLHSATIIVLPGKKCMYVAQSIVQKGFTKHIKSFYCRIKDNIACSQKVVKRIMKIHVGQQPSDDLLWSLVRPSTESVLERQSMKTTFRLSTEDI
jgi:hypothetical protein